MSRYIYKGRSKVIKKIPELTIENEFLIDSCAFIIIASSPISNTKKLGCPLVNDYFGTDVLDFHLEVIKSVCRNPEITIVGGYDIKKILKHKKREEYIVIENVLHELTNSAEDLRIGLNAIRNNNAVILDGNFIPTTESFSLLFKNKTNSGALFSKRKSLNIGCEINSENNIAYFSYKPLNKMKGIVFLGASDCLRLKKKILGSTFNKNKFDFEMYNEIKMEAIEDTSNSLRIDEDFTDDDN